MCARQDQFMDNMDKGTQLFKDGDFEKALPLLQAARKSGRLASGEPADPLHSLFHQHGTKIGSMITDIEMKIRQTA